MPLFGPNVKNMVAKNDIPGLAGIIEEEKNKLETRKIAVNGLETFAKQGDDQALAALISALEHSGSHWLSAVISESLMRISSPKALGALTNMETREKITFGKKATNTSSVQETAQLIEFPGEAFISNVTRGRKANYRIHILDFYNFHDALQCALIKLKIPNSEVISLLNSKLVGICPKCWTGYNGEWLSYVATISQIGANKIIGLTSYSMRFLEGKCKNSKCGSNEILILFNPCASSPIGLLSEALKDKEIEIRKAAAYALAEITNKGSEHFDPDFLRVSIPALTNALKDEDAEVRQAAEEVLERANAKQTKKSIETTTTENKHNYSFKVPTDAYSDKECREKLNNAGTLYEVDQIIDDYYKHQQKEKKAVELRKQNSIQIVREPEEQKVDEKKNVEEVPETTSEELRSKEPGKEQRFCTYLRKTVILSSTPDWGWGLTCESQSCLQRCRHNMAVQISMKAAIDLIQTLNPLECAAEDKLKDISISMGVKDYTTA